MEKVKESFQKYKYHIATISSLILICLIYNKFKGSTEILEEEKKEQIKSNENTEIATMIQTELRKLNKSLLKLNPDIVKEKETNEFYDKLFKKDIIKKAILIDSIGIADDNNTYNTSDYKIDFGIDGFADIYKNVIGFRLVKATLPNIIHQVNDNNNTFIIHASSSDTTVTLTNGSYTFAKLGYHIEDKLNEVMAGFKVTPNTTIYKYTITQSSSYYFKWKSSNSLAYRLFGADNIDEGSSFYSSLRTFRNIVDQTKHFVDLVITEIPSIGCKKNFRGKDVIDRIPMTSPSGSLVYYMAPVTEFSSINYFYPMKLSSLSIQLFDHNSDQLYDSQNGHNYFEFELTILNNTSKLN